MPVLTLFLTLAWFLVIQDARLMKEYFGLGCDYQDMSPVVMPSGYTRDFLDGKITEEQQLERIRHSYSSVSAKADVVSKERQYSDMVYLTMPCVYSIKAFRLY